MVQHLVAWTPAMLTLAFFFIFVLNWSRKDNWARTIACLFVAAISLRYLAWRLTETVLPHAGEGNAEFYWLWTVFIVEVLGFFDIAVFLIIMSRNVDRSSEATRLEAQLFARRPDALPTVDIFIPTYNEPLDVLERSILGALALDYPRHKLKVYVLDDQRRSWLKRFCEDKGAIHVTRPDNAHAKAGNINHGLTVSSGEFVAVFDADFVPNRKFLRRTLGFFLDPSIGVVQTPQHFFNKDPVQSNLWLGGDWPDEQRLFFDEMAACRDAWNVSFCCGSCSIMRRQAIAAIGGIPTESVTEDLLTTLACLNKGYITRYLNERLAMGLAAENLEGYFIQRGRWCRGGIQSLFLASGPLRGPGLSLFQRLMFLPLSWLVRYLVQFAILIVPVVYLWTGLAPLYFAGTDDIVYYQAPVIAAYFLLMQWLLPNRYLPLLSTAIGAFSTFRILPVVIASLIKPFGVPFRVTPKGSGNGRERHFDGFTFGMISLLIALTAFGSIFNIVPEWTVQGEGQFTVVAMYWSAANLLVLLVAALICFEVPRPAHETFRADEATGLRMGRQVVGRLRELSMAAATIDVESAQRAWITRDCTVEIIGVPPFQGQIQKVADNADGTVRLEATFDNVYGRARDALIVKLYTGDYSMEVSRVRPLEVIRSLARRAFGRPQQARWAAGAAAPVVASCSVANDPGFDQAECA